MEGARRGGGSFLRRVVEVEDGEDRLLRPLDGAALLHAFASLLLLLEQLALARDVAAVALREHVLAASLHRFACDDARADRRLNRDVEELSRDFDLEPLDER